MQCTFILFHLYMHISAYFNHSELRWTVYWANMVYLLCNVLLIQTDFKVQFSVAVQGQCVITL